jgi:hypothetical protein
MKNWGIFLFSAAFLLSRIPFLNMGFGSDVDAWIYADTCFAIFKTGKYFVSRGIGFPVYEFLIALILKIDEMTISGDWILTNVVAMVSTVVCIILFKKILTIWKIGNEALLVIAFAFMPIIWKNSTNTMDYMLSLMFILLSHYLILHKTYLFSALVLGCAVGVRPSNGVMVFPLMYLIWKENRINAVRFSIICLIVSFSFFVPFLSAYKTFTLEQYRNYMYLPSTGVMYLMKIGYRIFYEFLGFDAALFLFMLLPFSKKGLKKFLQSLKDGDTVVIFSTVTILSFLILFFKYPFQPEYLIPSIYCIFILAGKFFNKKNLIIFSTLIIINGFFVMPGIDFSFSSTGKVTIRPSPAEEGYFFTEIKKRKEMIKFQKIFPRMVLEKNSIVILHGYHAVYVYFNRHKILNNGSYFDSKRRLICLDQVYDPKEDIYITYLAMGALRSLLPEYTIYYIPCSVRLIKGRSNIDLLNYNPVLLQGLKPLDY